MSSTKLGIFGKKFLDKNKIFELTKI